MTKVKITEQNENKLLNRKELTLEIENESGTPKNDDIAGKVAALLNADKNLVVVKGIYQQFGAKKCVSFANVYDTADDLKKTEPKKKEKKSKAEQPAATAPAQVAAPAQAPAAQKPAEKK